MTDLAAHGLKVEQVCPKIAEAFLPEPHLLHPSPEDLEASFHGGLSLIGIAPDGEAVCHTRLTPLTAGWFELGGTWVCRNYRRLGIAEEMYSQFLPLHREKDILATTTNDEMLRIGELFGFVRVQRRDLPEEVWRASCTCPPIKIGPQGPDRCPLAFGEPQCSAGRCYFRVTPETAARHNFR